MALTAKPIATISYNTESFLKRTLDALFDARIIEDYRYIFHYGEDGDKNHFHVWIQPNKRLDTASLREEFKEAPLVGDKALGCLPFRSSKTDHWIMYAIHDGEYLRNHNSEGEDGKLPYELSAIVTPFTEQLERDFRKAISLRKTTNQDVIDRLTKEHQSLEQIMYSVNANPLAIVTIKNALERDRWERDSKEQQEARAEKVKALANFSDTVKTVEELPTIKGNRQSQIITYHVDKRDGTMEVVNREFMPTDSVQMDLEGHDDE